MLEIVGAVDPLGAVGLGEVNQLWTLSVSLRAWRNADGTLVHKALRLTRGRLSTAEFDELQACFPAWGVVRVLVAGEPHWQRDDSGLGRWEAEVVEVLDGAAVDAELEAWVEQQRQPVRIADPFFGTLQLDRRLNAYDGRRDLAAGPYDLSIERGHDDDDSARDQALVASARSPFERMERELPRYFGRAADQLLKIHNANWGDEGLPVLSREEFIRSLRLSSVRFGSTAGMSIYLDPGELFLGHWIEILADFSGEIRQVALAG